MNENNIENLDSINKEIEGLSDDATDDEKDEHYQKIVSQNKQLYTRLKKSEGFEMIDGKWVKPEPKENKPKEESKTETSLSQKDLITLMKSNIAEDDVEEVLNYAKFRNMSLKDTLESDVIKNLLKVKEEFRASADATHTGTTAKSKGQVSDDDLLLNAKKGLMPTTDADMQRLAKLSLRRR